MSKTKTYKVKSPISRDNQPLDIGADVDLNPKEAAELLACGAIEDPDTAVVETETKAGKKSKKAEKTDGNGDAAKTDGT